MISFRGGINLKEYGSFTSVFGGNIPSIAWLVQLDTSLSPMWQEHDSQTTPADEDGEVIGQVVDLSGNGNHVTQPVATSKPVYLAVDGLPTADYDANDYLAFANLDLLRNVASATVITLVRFDTNVTGERRAFEAVTPAGTSRLIVGGSADQWRIGGRQLDADTFDQAIGGNPIADTWFVFSAQVDWSGATIKGYEDGNPAIENLAFQAGGLTSDTASQWIYWGDSSGSIGGKSNGLWIAVPALTDAQRLAFEQQLMDRAGISYINFEDQGTVIAHATSGKDHIAFPGAATAANGDRLIVARVATSHSSADGEVWIWRQVGGAGAWSGAQVLVSASYDYRFSSLTLLSDNRLALVVSKRQSDTTLINEVDLYFSSDNGVTWSAKINITNGFDDWCYAGSSILELGSDYLIALSGQDIGDAATARHVKVSKSSDSGATWSALSEVIDGNGVPNRTLVEPDLVVRSNGDVVCFFRYDNNAELYICTSADSGATWSAETLIKTEADARCAITKITDGRLLMVQRNTGFTVPIAQLLIGASDATAFRFKNAFSESPNFANKQMTYGKLVEDAGGLWVAYGMEDVAAAVGDIMVATSAI